MKHLFKQLKVQNAKVSVSFASCDRDMNIVNAEICDLNDDYVTLIDANKFTIAAVYRNIAFVSYRDTAPDCS